MKLNCLIFLTVLSVVVVTECKPLSDSEKAPCVDCEQIIIRKKRCIDWLLQGVLGPLYPRPHRSNYQSRHHSRRHHSRRHHSRRHHSSRQDTRYEESKVYIGNGQHTDNLVKMDKVHEAYIGNGQYNSNNVTINEAHKVYIGNGDHNNNRVMINKADEIYVGNGKYNNNHVMINGQLKTNTGT